MEIHVDEERNEPSPWLCHRPANRNRCGDYAANSACEMCFKDSTRINEPYSSIWDCNEVLIPSVLINLRPKIRK
jgi:hypothetical protein